MIRALSPKKLPLPYRRRKAGILDLEWMPDSYELRVCGVRYRGRYRDFGTIENFLNWFLLPENDGIEIYAHYGGRADFCFLIPALVSAGLESEGLVAGSSVFSLTIRKGRRRHHLRDSFHLFLCTLDAAAKTFAGKSKSSCAFDAPIRELREYNENDCLILDDALEGLDRHWAELGTHIGLTNASTAFSLLRARYWTDPVPTIGATNDIFRHRAFFCSIVAPFVRSVRAALDKTGAPFAVGYDQTSAHPRSYAEPMPGEQIEGTVHQPAPDSVWFLDADIHIPSSVHIPPIPARTKEGRIVFPTGRWRAILCKEQVEALERCGGCIDKAHWYHNFKPHYDLQRFAHDLFARKAEADRVGNDALRTVIKYALNGGGFGKFGESPHRMMLVTGPLSAHHLYDKSGEPRPEADKIRILTPSLAMVPTFRAAPHEHVPMASITGARTMTRLIRDMWRFEEKGAEILYGDTDCIHATRVEDIPVTLGEGLGEYKIEYARIEDGYYAGPKFYAIKDTSKPITVVRAKSFPTARYGELQSNGKRRGLLIASDEWRPTSAVITYEKVRVAAMRGLDWDVEHERETEETINVQFERMRRIPETLAAYGRGGTLYPGDHTVKKDVRAPRPSRCFDAKGFSRPWDIEEL